MRKSEILTTLIDRFFSFDAEKGNHDDYSMDEFIGYLNSKSNVKELEIRKIAGEENKWVKDESRTTSIDISILLVMMYHYAKGYIKKALKESCLQTPDEFSFLITLMTYESMSKSELITKQVMEKTSGSEVIRRLINRGLIIESADTKDKRSIRVSITKTGREEIIKTLPLMGDVSQIVVGNLSSEEINTLSYLLKKLDYFHNDIYINKREHSLNEILNLITYEKNL